MLIAGGVAVNVVERTVFGPDKPVAAYLDALVAGDAELSRELIGSGAEDGQDALLSDAVYGAATGRISGFAIAETTIDDGAATVTAEVTQAEETSTIDFTLTRTGTTNLLFDEWRLDGPEPTAEVRLVVPEGLQSVTVNGTDVTLPDERTGGYAGLSSVSLPALPGRYVVEPPASTTYLSYGRLQTITVTTDPSSPPGGVLFRASATPAAETEAIARVMAALETCLASTEPSPTGCPNRSYMFGDPEDVRDPRWTLDRAPTFTLEQSYRPGTYRLVSHDALATFSYERNVEFDKEKPPRWKREEDTRSLYLSASVAVLEETLQVEPD